MEIIVNHIDEFEKEVLIRVPWDEVAQEYDDLLSRYAKVPIKGFRSGNAPYGLIESTFKAELRNDLAAGAAKRFCRAAMEKNDLRSAGGLSITEITIDKSNYFAFKTSFIALPKIELPDYSGYLLSGESDREKRDEILERLLNTTNITLHHSLVEEELRYSESIPESNDEEQLEQAAKRVKLMLIIKQIARQDAIEVDQRDLEERISLLAKENEVTKEQLTAYLQQNGALERVADSLLAENVLGYIIDITEQNN